VRLLLDTYTFLWFLLEDPQLSTTASDFTIDPTNEIEVSPATYWEIAINIKMSLDKYELPDIEPKRTAALAYCPEAVGKEASS
jgi:PIN domain nuclease of toxin-antitoxin system